MVRDENLKDVKLIDLKTLQCKCCGSDQIEFIGFTSEIELLQCRNCEYSYKEKFPDDLNFTTSSVYHKKSGDSALSDWPRSIEFLTPAFCMLPDRTMKILDFGCGDSDIPDRLRRMDHRVIAVDIYPPEKHHPDRLTGDIMDLDIPLETFDLIYSYEVFEGIYQPRHVLRRLCNLLKEEGLLLIHADLYSERVLSDKSLNNHNCSFYTKKTFEKMLSPLGCKIVHLSTEVVIARKI